jgi:leader peptidase (prepilin peptidase)/N-methyltransferase
MFIIALCFIFLLGACLGSFISVVVERINKDRKSIIFGRSLCPKCRKKLKAIDMIPIISYIFLHGKCRSCHKKISIHYPALELFSGLTFITLFLRFRFFTETSNGLILDNAALLSFIIYSVYAAFLIAIFFYDLLFSEIPDMFLFPLIGITLIGSLILGKPDLTAMFIGVIIALFIFGGQYLVSKGAWLGEGDIYLSIAMALAFGWRLFLISVFFTYFTGGIAAIFLLAAKKVSKKSAIPFAPFMVLGTLLTIFFGEEILNWYLSTVTF